MVRGGGRNGHHWNDYACSHIFLETQKKNTWMAEEDTRTIMILNGDSDDAEVPSASFFLRTILKN